MKRSQPRIRARLLPVVAAVATLSGLCVVPAHASSHREAPFITTTPKVDGTDFYMFRSYEPSRRRAGLRDADRQLPAAAGRLRRPELLHAGSERAVRDPRRQQRRRQEDLTFQFRFNNNLRATSALTIGGKQVADPADPGRAQVPARNAAALERERDLSRSTWCAAIAARGTRGRVTNAHGRRHASSTSRSTTSATKTIPQLRGLRAPAHLHTSASPAAAATGRVFVGQRKDPFAVNLGEIFDLVNAPVAVSRRPRRQSNAAPDDLDRQERHHARARGADELPDARRNDP